jgi:serine/threonine protein kinase/WD40 repeat protein
MGTFASRKMDVSDKYALLDQLAEDFAARYRRGDRPALTEYAERHPELADDIRELFPALVQVEQADADLHAAEGSVSSGPAALTNVGDYQILREVGRGGMGVVYEAEQRSLGRRVALKLLPLAGMNDARTLVRFQREARAAAKLHHTNIVPVFEVGQNRKFCYYAMQLIQGQALNEIIRELRLLRGQSCIAEEPRLPCAAVDASALHAPARPVVQSLLTGQFRSDKLTHESASPQSPQDRTETQTVLPSSGHAPTIHSANSSSAKPAGLAQLSSIDSAYHHYVRTVASAGQQVADALAYAHARGIIHRDIKPSNLMLDASGVVWVTDFGLCKSTDADLTETGDLLGTLRYMAPERFCGRGDARVDTYALGLTLYELLVLKPAFPINDRLGLMDAIQTKNPPRPRTIEPRIPRDLETIVLKAIDRDPDGRYASAQEMGDDLRRFLDDEPPKARRAGPFERSWRWCRRNRTVAGLAASVLLLLTALALVSSIGAFRLSSALKDSNDNLAKANEANATANANLWESLMSQARASRMTRQPGQRFDSLRAIKRALALPLPPDRSLHDLRTEAVAALMLPDLEVGKEWNGFPVGSRHWAIDTAFQRYARIDIRGCVSVRRMADDDELFHLPGSEGVADELRCKFSPDGNFLYQTFVVGQKRRVARLWRIDGAEPVTLAEGQYRDIAFSPDSRRAAMSEGNGDLRVLNLPDGTERTRWNSGMRPISLAWNPKFSRLALQQESLLKILDVDTGHVLLESKRNILWDSPLVWHPDGERIAVAGANGTEIILLDARNGRQVLPPLQGHGGGIYLSFNHAGDRLISNGWENLFHLWDVRTGRQLLTIPGQGVASFSSDDQQLAAAFVQPRASILRVRTGDEFCTITVPDKSRDNGPYLNLRTPVHKNGRLAAVNVGGRTAIVDIVRGEELVRLPLDQWAVRFDADGHGLWTASKYGLLRWPIRFETLPVGRMRVGPPSSVGGFSSISAIPAVGDGARLIAIPSFDSGTLLKVRDAKEPRMLGPQSNVRYCAISPDERWVATGSHWLPADGAGAKIWDAATGEHVADLPVGGRCGVGFDPGGRWLVTTGLVPRIWKVGEWTEGPPLNGSADNSTFAFDATGGLLALGDSAPGVVRIVSPITGQEIVRLSAPEASRLGPSGFSPDGGRLVTIGSESGAVHIFDLRAIRAQLAKLGLDWDAPPLPTAPADARDPIQVEIELGDFQQKTKADPFWGNASRQTAIDLKHAVGEAIAVLRDETKSDPSNACAQSNLAWFLSVGPMDFREPKEALRAARKAVELEASPDYLGTLGVALYRNGEFREAVATLERSLGGGEGEFDAYSLFTLAMCHHMLGDAAKSKECYDRARQWFGQKRATLPAFRVAELIEFQAEAEELLTGGKVPRRP